MKAISRRAFSTGIALLPALRFTAAFSQSRVTPEEARAIAKEAYIYGYPLADNYRVEHAYFIDPKNPEFKAPWNHLKNISDDAVCCSAKDRCVGVFVDGDNDFADCISACLPCGRISRRRRR